MTRARSRSGSPAASILLALAALAPAAWATAGRQDGPPAEAPEPLSETRLNERDRERLHPAAPLELRGSEEGGRDPRARTPALARSDRIAAAVDPDEHYERTVALYEDRARLSAPPKRAAARPEESAVDAPAKGAATPATDLEPDSGLSWWVYGLGLVALCSLAFWLLARFEAAARTPQRG